MQSCSGDKECSSPHAARNAAQVYFSLQMEALTVSGRGKVPTALCDITARLPHTSLTSSRE